MPRRAIERINTSWRISAEAKRLLELMAEKLGISQSAVFEQAIREKARREQVSLANGGLEGAPLPSPEREQAAWDRLRELAERARAGNEVPAEEIRREVEIVRARTKVIPAQQPGPPTLEWQERFQRLLEEVRAGVPEEWTPEELEERIAQTIADVRASHARRR